jgi:putative FmdB family regulatory protein
MPLYEFECHQCGTFEEFLSLKSYVAQLQCPDCDGNANRIYTPLNFYKTSKSYRKARAINEKNQESPQVKKIDNTSHSEHNHSHHHVSHSPWMVGH